MRAKVRELPCRGNGLALTLLMLGVIADNEDLSLSLDYLALVAHFLY